MAMDAYHSRGKLIYHSFRMDLLRSIFDRNFNKIVLLVLQQCGADCIAIGGRSTTFDILGCVIELVDGSQCKCKRKR